MNHYYYCYPYVSIDIQRYHLGGPSLGHLSGLPFGWTSGALHTEACTRLRTALQVVIRCCRICSVPMSQCHGCHDDL